MSVKVSQVKFDGNRRYTSQALHVYVDNTRLHKVADDWFDRNNVRAIQVKSKAWASIVRRLNKIVGAELAKHFGVSASDCRWDRRCGCSCGCSPGFRIRNVYGMLRHNAWAKVTIDDSVVKEFDRYVNGPKIASLLKGDLEAAQRKIFVGTQHAEM